MTAPFEVLGFTAAPASGDVAVVELSGRFAPGRRDPRPPRLLVEDGDRRVEVEAAAVAEDAAGWRGTYALPLELARSGAYALALRGLVLDLPDPDHADDRFAELARELNRLRRAVEAAEQRADARVAAAEAEANAARGQAAQVERRVAEADARTAATQGELAALRTQLVQEQDAARTAADALEHALEAARDEAAELRRALKTARAELEAARREQTAAEGRAQTVQAELTRTTVARPRERVDPPTLHAEPVPAGEPVERVRVLGRERRAPDPDAPPTPVDAPPLDPPSRATALLVVTMLVLLVLVVLVVLLG